MNVYRDRGRPAVRLLQRWHYFVSLGTLRVVGYLPQHQDARVTSAVLDCMGNPIPADPSADPAQIDVLDEGMTVLTESGSTYLLGKPDPSVLNARNP